MTIAWEYETDDSHGIAIVRYDNGLRITAQSGERYAQYTLPLDALPSLHRFIGAVIVEEAAP